MKTLYRISTPASTYDFLNIPLFPRPGGYRLFPLYIDFKVFQQR
jgi:hypothetical protein